MTPPIKSGGSPGETCKILQSSGIPIDTDLPEVGTLSPSDSIYLASCEKILESMIRIQREKDPKKSPKFWTPDQVRLIHEFSQKNKILVKAAVRKPEIFEAVLFTEGSNILMNLLFPVDFSERSLRFALNHEAGHLRDRQKFLDLLPAARPYFEKGTSTPVEFQVQIYGVMMLMSFAILPEEQKRFMTLCNEEFNCFEDMEPGYYSMAWTLFAELFRWGEEIQDPETKNITLDTISLDSISKSPQGPSYDKLSIAHQWANLAIIASLQEMGVWQDVLRRKEIDSKKVRMLDPGKLEFFRMAMRAAQSYFPKPPPAIKPKAEKPFPKGPANAPTSTSK